MALSNDEIALAAGLGLLAFLGGKRAAGATPARSRAPLSPDADGAALMKRANQTAALAWSTEFTPPMTSEEAAAMARWIGLESSGNALAKSRLNERGLMQAGAHTVAEGGLSSREWDALVNPATTRKQQAGLAMKYVAWLWERAKRYVEQAPETFVPDQIWYAKLWHQWPVDVRDGELHGPAVDMARELAGRWYGDAKRMHRLRAANVVAFGTPTP